MCGMLELPADLWAVKMECGSRSSVPGTQAPSSLPFFGGQDPLKTHWAGLISPRRTVFEHFLTLNYCPYSLAYDYADTRDVFPKHLALNQTLDVSRKLGSPLREYVFSQELEKNKNKNRFLSIHLLTKHSN